MMKQDTIDAFTKILSSKAPVPGGGGASALSGAIGSSLGSMVGNLTLGKKNYAEVQEDIAVLLEKLEKITEKLLLLMDEDAKAFEPLSMAYRLPKDTAEEKVYKEQVMEQALYDASLVPLQIMECCYQGILLQEEMAQKGTRIAISDVAVGVELLKAGLLGASMNVLTNTKSMKNRDVAEKLNLRVGTLSTNGREKAEDIFNMIMSQIS